MDLGGGGGSFKSGLFLSLMFLHHFNNIEHNIKQNIYWHGGNLSYTSMVLYIKTARMKLY